MPSTGNPPINPDPNDPNPNPQPQPQPAATVNETTEETENSLDDENSQE